MARDERREDAEGEATAAATAGSGPYTDPALRERLKAEITAGDKGGRPGQWSARKAQLLAHAYEAHRGGYTTDEHHKAASQRHLDAWTAEEWVTADGAPAERADGMDRYLPKDAWEKLSPEERDATRAKKRDADRRGEQFVPNTAAAKRAREQVTHD